MTNKCNPRSGFLMVMLFMVLMVPAYAQINWPSDQLLPTFPQTAQTQDLIILREKPPLSWEAEGPDLGHNTGRPESDGWLCQTGIDAPNQHMIYGPYTSAVPVGDHVANFRMKVDNNTANNDSIVEIDVRDANTGATLASKKLYRMDFSVASNYVDFSLPFTLNDEGHPLEFRIFWYGTSYTKVDRVWVNAEESNGELVLFASLKGIVNKQQPRIFSYEGDAFAEGRYTWLQSLGLDYNEPEDNWDLISKYRDEIEGIIIYDDAQPHTINLATTLAGNQHALIADPSLVARLTSEPYNLPVLADYRGQFANKLEVYQSLLDNYWPDLDKRVLVGLNPEVHKAALREYATAIGAATIWLDPEKAGESELLNSFLSSMPPGANMMGWWPNEAPGVERASSYGIATIASDWSSNLTVHSGMPREVEVKPTAAKPALENKIYVSFILSDGDNLQYVEHLMRKLWNNPDRGSVPIGWTVSPAMLDAMPGALDFYYKTARENDNLISGPSGYGYAYPNSWPDQSSLDQFVSKTEDYTSRAGLRVVTIWNTITGGIDQNVGESFAENASSLLGLTAQNTGGGLTIYRDTLPGMALSCNYCTNEQAMKDHIAMASEGWDGTSPRFVIIQAQPWQGVTPTSFMNVANSLNDDYEVVRPDQIFQLIRQNNGIVADPTRVYQPDAEKWYLLKNKDNGLYLRNAQGGKMPKNQVLLSEDDGPLSQWKFVENEGNWAIQNKKTQRSLLPQSTPVVSDETLVVVGNTTDEQGAFRVVTSSDSGFFHLQEAASGINLRSEDCGNRNNKTLVEFLDGEGQCTQWELIEAGSISKASSDARQRQNSGKATEQKEQDDTRVELASEVLPHPNPVSNRLKLSSQVMNGFSQSVEEEVQVQIINTSGQIVLQQRVSDLANAELDVTSLETGIYYVEVQLKDSIVVRKILKQ